MDQHGDDAVLDKAVTEASANVPRTIETQKVGLREGNFPGQPVEEEACTDMQLGVQVMSSVHVDHIISYMDARLQLVLGSCPFGESIARTTGNSLKPFQSICKAIAFDPLAQLAKDREMPL